MSSRTFKEFHPDLRSIKATEADSIEATLKNKKRQEASLEFLGLLLYFCFTYKRPNLEFFCLFLFAPASAQILDHHNKVSSEATYVVIKMRPASASVCSDQGETPQKCD